MATASPPDTAPDISLTDHGFEPLESRGLTYPMGKFAPDYGVVHPLGDGLGWTRLYVPGSLRHINVWLIEEEGGVAVVDTGVLLDSSKEAWAKALDGRPVTRVLVTHFHPDHLGCAGWLCAEHGAPLWMNRTEYLLARMLIADKRDAPPVEAVAQMVGAGWTPEQIAPMQERGWGNFARIVSEMPVGHITMREWHPVGVEEYGYVAPDPLNPDIIYGGKVTRHNRKTGDTQDVSPAASRRARGGEFRFIRTAPLLFSPVDPHILFLGSQYLLKTTNGGTSWQTISPDLSREKYETPQSVGIFEKYEHALGSRRGVIYAIVPSYKDVNLIWCGTDDGLIHLTRDGGKNWTNVTPPALTPWSKVSVMDAGFTEQFSHGLRGIKDCLHQAGLRDKKQHTIAARPVQRCQVLGFSFVKRACIHGLQAISCRKIFARCLPIFSASITGTALPICVYRGTSLSQIPKLGSPARRRPPVVRGPLNSYQSGNV